MPTSFAALGLILSLLKDEAELKLSLPAEKGHAPQRGLEPPPVGQTGF